MAITLEALGRELRRKRGGRGVREVGEEIGVSPATLSRVERGYLPDLTTFGKLCRWLDVDPGEVLEIKSTTARRPAAAVHFRMDRTLSRDAARALAEMILAAQRALMASESENR